MADKPTFVLYIVVGSGGEQEKARWIRLGAFWKARKGYSGKLEEVFRLYPPFNDPMCGLAIMPYESPEERNNNTNRGQRR